MYFNHVKPENGLQFLLDAVAARAQAHPVPYAHWYIDGGQEAKYDPALTCVSYHALEPARAALSAKMRAEIERPGMGPEALRSLMARMSPEDLGLNMPGTLHVLERFRLQGADRRFGDANFCTTFAQWTAREALRRAQPLHSAGTLRSAAKTKADERNDFR